MEPITAWNQLSQPAAVSRQTLRQDLQRDAPAETCVFRVVDLAHAAGPKRRDDAVATDGRARGEIHRDLHGGSTKRRRPACGDYSAGLTHSRMPSA